MILKTERLPAARADVGFLEFVLLIAAMMALGALGIDSMLPNLPAIGEALGVTDENRRQLIITLYLLGFGAAQLIYGPLADRYGRKPVLMVGLSLYTGFSLIAAFARSFELLLVARVLQGIGAAATRAIPVSIVRDRYAGREVSAPGQRSSDSRTRRLSASRSRACCSSARFPTASDSCSAPPWCSMTGIQSCRRDACATKPLPCRASMASGATIDRGELLAIFVGGAGGALARTGAVIAFGDPARAWPWSIFVINVTGAFALGYVAARPPLRLPRGIYAAALLGTGFCGALTTFSTMMLELLQMLDAGRLGLAALYAAASITGGLAAIALATRLARSLASRA